jgi:hypothetical protein
MALERFQMPGIGDTDLRWRDADAEDVGRRAYNAGVYVFDEQASRELELVKLSMLYNGFRPGARFGAQATAFLDRVTKPASTAPKLSLNAVRAVVDTAVAKVTGLDVRPSYLTEGGDWREQRMAKQLEKFSDAQLFKAKARTLGPTIFRDACWGDIGIAHVYAGETEPVVERVLPWEIAVDYEDGRYGNPWQIFRRKWISKDELMARFPRSRDEISVAGASDPSGRMAATTPQGDSLTQQVMVIEAWYRAAPGRKGRHVIAIENHALLAEEWTRDHFPFAFVRYSEGIEGFYGMGMGWHLKGNQLEINEYLDAIQEHVRKMAMHIGISESSRIVQEHVNNRIMSIIKFADRPPVNVQIGDLPQALVDRLETAYRHCFQQEGVPLADSQSASRPGLNSEPSIRANRDIGTERFSVASKAYEQFILDVSELLIEAGAEVAKRKDGYVVLVPGKRFAQRLNFKDVDLDRDKYILRPLPTSSLPRDYQGRLATVQDWLKMGAVDPTTAMRLLDLPDTDAALSLKVASLEFVLHEIELILDGEKPSVPGPYHPLQQCVEMGIASIQRASQDGAPEDVLAALDAWIVECQYRLQQGQPAPAANQAPGLPGGTPQARPEPLPTSPLVPQAGAAPTQPPPMAA